MAEKIIISLAGGTGAWEKPYKEAGYTVYNITLAGFAKAFFRANR